VQSEFTQNRQAIQPRHVQIEKDKLWNAAADGRQRFLTVGCFEQFETGAGEGPRHAVPCGFFVVGDENSKFGHR